MGTDCDSDCVLRTLKPYSKKDICPGRWENFIFLDILIAVLVGNPPIQIREERMLNPR